MADQPPHYLVYSHLVSQGDREMMDTLHPGEVLPLLPQGTGHPTQKTVTDRVQLLFAMPALHLEESVHNS